MDKTTAYTSFVKSETEYLKIILANLIGRFGDSIDSIAYGWMVYELTGSTTWLAILYGVNSIPTILFQPFAGALVEFLDKKAAVIMCDLGRGCIVFCTSLMLILGILEPWHLLILTFLNSCFEAFRIPGSLAMIPAVLRKEDYSIGLSLNQSACRVFELIGLGCAGAVIGLLGTGGAVMIDALTFFASALLLLLVKMPVGEKNEEHKNISVKRYINDLTAGIRYFNMNQIAVTICAIGFFLNITAVPLEKLQAAYVNECLGLGVYAMSIGSIFMTLGLILGTMVFVYAEKIISNKNIMVYGGIFIGLLYFGLACAGRLESLLFRSVVYAALLFLFGLINSLIGMSVQITMMSTTPSEYLGRVGSIFNAAANSSIPAGSFLLAMILPFLSIIQTYVLFGMAAVVIFLYIGRRKL